MPTYTAPVRDMEFVLNDVLKVQSAGIQGYEELEAEFISAILNEAGKITSEVLAPLNAKSDNRAAAFDDLSALIKAVANEVKPGDHILVMSNGGFGGIHQKIVNKLKNN